VEVFTREKIKATKTRTTKKTKTKKRLLLQKRQKK
jgi:hypothetical protein